MVWTHHSSTPVREASVTSTRTLQNSRCCRDFDGRLPRWQVAGGDLVLMACLPRGTPSRGGPGDQEDFGKQGPSPRTCARRRKQGRLRPPWEAPVQCVELLFDLICEFGASRVIWAKNSPSLEPIRSRMSRWVISMPPTSTTLQSCAAPARREAALSPLPGQAAFKKMHLNTGLEHSLLKT